MSRARGIDRAAWAAMVAVHTVGLRAAIGAPWPGGVEHAIAISGASTDLSGAVWNPSSRSLWVVRQNRQVWEFAYSEAASGFALVRTLVLPSAIGDDIEACAQVDFGETDTIYTLSEDHGRIARVVGLDGTPTVEHVWNLEQTNNGHALPAETDGAGAEALEFVPDANLVGAGFRLPDGSAFGGSVKGMGGLFFVGHQIDGRLHVFDVSPLVSDDFINHGSFLTSGAEIAGLHFDRADGRMSIWHNPDDVNSLEVSTLSSNGAAGKLDTLERFDSAMPMGNLEGIALVDAASCGAFASAPGLRALFLTRDGGSPELIWFKHFPCGCGVARPCAEDLNGDGAVDTADLGILLSQLNMTGPDADINGDCVVNTADLGVLIGSFGSPCD